MIKKTLAVLALGGLGVLAIAAPRPHETEKISRNEQSNIEILAQTDLIPPYSLEAKIDTANQKAFNLPEITPKDTLYLAAAILGEASGETNNPQYIQGVISSIFNRAKDEGSIKRAILGKTIQPNGEVVYHYTPFDPRDPNYPRVMRFLNSETARKRDPTWKQCYSLAINALNGTLKIEHPLSSATHFFVGGYNPQQYLKGSDARRKGFPSFAYEMGDSGKFVLDANKNRIPLKPVGVVPVSNGKKAFFYNLGN